MTTKYLQEGDWFSGKIEGGFLVILVSPRIHVAFKKY